MTFLLTYLPAQFIYLLLYQVSKKFYFYTHLLIYNGHCLTNLNTFLVVKYASKYIAGKYYLLEEQLHNIKPHTASPEISDHFQVNFSGYFYQLHHSVLILSHMYQLRSVNIIIIWHKAPFPTIKTLSHTFLGSSAYSFAP